MDSSSMTGIIFLGLSILLNGTYGLGLKPVNSRCRSLAELELFNACFSGTALVGAAISAGIQGSFYLPAAGILAAALFGSIFSVCVFTNLKALEEGPLSLTTLIVNFSLIIPLIHSFVFLNEKITVLRVIGILLLGICMLLITNPKVTGEKKMSGKWLTITLIAAATNGILAVIAKSYALATDNVYAIQFLLYSYFFASITSLLLFICLRRKQPQSEKRTFRQFFSPVMIFLIALIGFANFGLNLLIILLAILMDGAIVYPVVQGAGPMMSIIGSRLFFREEISLKKWVSILLGILAIVLLNL